MQLEFKHAEDQLTVRLIGELDHHGAGEIRDKIDAAVLQRGYRHLVLDFSGLTFMDSSGIGLIMGRYRLMAAHDGDVRITGLHDRLESVIRLAGLDKLPLWDTSERSNQYETCQ